MDKNVTLGRYNNSLNFAFGFARNKTTPGQEDFDILNNPYVDIIPYRLSAGEVMSILPRDAIGPCSANELARFVPKKHLGWYP